MDLNEIKELLEKYYRGETSLQEEERLKTFFARAQVPESLAPDKKFFTALAEKDNKESDEVFQANLEYLIEREWQKESKRRFIIRPSWVGGIAAAAVILFLVFIHQNPQPMTHADTFRDPGEAYEETRKILLSISYTMNGGAEKLNTLSELNQSLSALEKLKMIDQSIDHIKTNSNEKN